MDWQPPSGINKLKLRTLQFGLYRNNPADPASLAFDKIGAFAEDQGETIWIDTWGAGLERFNPYTGRFVYYRHTEDDHDTIASNVIMTLASGDSGGLWIGTLGEGLEYFDGMYKSHYTALPRKRSTTW